MGSDLVSIKGTRNGLLILLEQTGILKKSERSAEQDGVCRGFLKALNFLYHRGAQKSQSIKKMSLKIYAESMV